MAKKMELHDKGKIRGIRRRWLLNSVGVVLLILALALGTFIASLRSYYYTGTTDDLMSRDRGGLTYLDGRWQGYLNDLDCVVDMGEVTDIHKVSSRFMQLIGPVGTRPGRSIA